MRVDPQAFDELNVGISKYPLYTVEVAFTTDYSDLVYFTSHDDAAYPPGAIVYTNIISENGISGTTQKLNTKEGRASIGNMSIKLVDVNEQITTLIYDKLQLGRGLREKRVRVYMGYEGLDWSDYVLIQTQIVERLEFTNAEYDLVCSDIQRSERKEVFRLSQTNLQSSLLVGDTTINVYSTANFQTMAHGTSFTDAPSATVGYVRIDDEIIRYTGKTSTSFTGCTRGVLNTKEVDHTVDTSLTADRRQEVTEVVYLEMPAAKMAYAIMTGVLYGQGGATLPDNWHLGISTDWVRLADFTGVGVDIWDPSDDTQGYILRFVGIEETDGKKFIEKDLLFPIMFSPVYPTGELGLKRLTGVLSDAGYVVELNESNVVRTGPLKQNMQDVVNQIEVAWNWNADKDAFTRYNYLIDASSQAIHQDAPIEKIELRGLHGSRHTNNTLNWIFDTWRDRFSGPPLTIKVSVSPSLNTLEVGDVVKLNLSHVRDAAGGTSINRAFEVQAVSINWLTGDVSLDLFGSSRKADAVQRATLNTILDDTDYQQGTALTAYLDPADYIDSGGLLRITGDCTISGATAMTGGNGFYYYVGDLQIDSGVTVTITDNVGLWVAGNIQVNGDLVSGGGIPGVAATSAVWNAATGTSGALGTTQAQGGIRHQREGHTYYQAYSAPATAGKYNAMPEFNIEYDSATGAIKGLPTDLRGTSGGQGGNAIGSGATTVFCSLGGDGGAGGAGLLTVSRGVSIGASGSINLSGEAGTVGDFCSIDNVYAGGGAGGAPGGWLCILDGSLAVVPDDSKFVAHNGLTPTSGNVLPLTTQVFWFMAYYPNQINRSSSPYVGLSTSFDSRLANFKLTYIKEPVDAANDPDEGTLTPPTNLLLTSGTDELFINADGTIEPRIKAAWTASTDPRVIVYEIQYKLSSGSLWSGIQIVEGEVEAFITNVKAGDSYDVRVRAAGLGITSVWVTSTGHTVIGKTEPPSDVAAFTIKQDGSNLILKWQSVTDTDLAGYDIRYNQQGLGTYEDATPLTYTTRGTNITTADVPSGDWTFYIKAVDTSGNQSVNAKTANISFVSDYEIIIDQLDHPAWLGTKTNIVEHWTGVIFPQSQNLASADGWDTFDVFVPNPYANCYYEGVEIDTDYDDPVRVWSEITSYLSGIPISGEVANPQFQIDYRLSAGSYDGFEDWIKGNATARYIKPRLHIDTTVGVPIVSEFRTVIDLAERTEKASGVVVPAGGTTITFADPYHLPPFVRVFVSGSAALYVVRENITTTGFSVYVYNESGVDVGGTIDWEAEGV